MRVVALTELYMKIDTNGTGVAEMQKVVLGGSEYQLRSMASLLLTCCLRTRTQPQ
jgi:hypothetical protein